MAQDHLYRSNVQPLQDQLPGHQATGKGFHGKVMEIENVISQAWKCHEIF